MPDEERKKRAAAVTAKIMRELQIGTEEEIAQIESDLKDTQLCNDCSNKHNRL